MRGKSKDILYARCVRELMNTSIYNKISTKDENIRKQSEGKPSCLCMWVQLQPSKCSEYEYPCESEYILTSR